MNLPRYVDRQFAGSFLLTIAFYAVLMAALVTASWWLEELAAIAFFAFLLWAYRWPIGARLGLCARRPGALPGEPGRGAAAERAR